MHPIANMLFHHLITLIQSVTVEYIAPFLDYLKKELSHIDGRVHRCNQTTQTTQKTGTGHFLPTQ